LVCVVGVLVVELNGRIYRTILAIAKGGDLDREKIGGIFTSILEDLGAWNDVVFGVVQWGEFAKVIYISSNANVCTVLALAVKSGEFSGRVDVLMGTNEFRKANYKAMSVLCNKSGGDVILPMKNMTPAQLSQMSMLMASFSRHA